MVELLSNANIISGPALFTTILNYSSTLQCPSQDQQSARGQRSYFSSERFTHVITRELWYDEGLQVSLPFHSEHNGIQR